LADDIRFIGINDSEAVGALDYLFGTGMPKARDVDQLPHVVLLDLKFAQGGRIGDAAPPTRSPPHRPPAGLIPTSCKEKQDIINGYRLGYNSDVRKPVDFDRFMEAARQPGLYWLLLNEPLPA